MKMTAVQHIPAKRAAIGEWSALRRAVARAMPRIMKLMTSRDTSVGVSAEGRGGATGKGDGSGTTEDTDRRCDQ